MLAELENRFYSARDSLYKRERRSPLNILLNVLIVLFLSVFIIEVSFNLIFTGIYVVEESMTPTLTGAVTAKSKGGDFIYIDKCAKPDYGNIVVVYRETSDGIKGNIIKRVVAFGGDTVEIAEGVLFVNGEALYEPYIDENYNSPANEFPEHVVEEGCMFLLGDNRNGSNDSRQNGDYPLSDLVGVVPKWSMDMKSFTTKFYTFFKFTLWE